MAAAFPVGIPVGEVVQTGDGGSVKVRPFADFSRLEFVRVVDYGVTGLVEPGRASPPAGAPAPRPLRGPARHAGRRRARHARPLGPAAAAGHGAAVLRADDPGAAARALYRPTSLPLLPALAVFQFSLATPERLPGPLLLAMGVLLDLLLGGPGAPVGVSALGFVLIRASVVANRRYLVGVPFLFQWMGFCLLTFGNVSWSGSSPRSGPGPTSMPAAGAGAISRGGRGLSAAGAAARPRAAARSAERARGLARHRAARRDHVMMRYRKGDGERSGLFTAAPCCSAARRWC